MERQKKVLDASVIVKEFANEVNSDKTKELINAHIEKSILIVVPDLLFIEVLNAFRFKNKNESRLKEINNNLKEFQFKIERTNKNLLDAALENSIKYNITLYDSLYVAVAQFHGCPLITANERLYNIPNVIPLEKI